MGAPFLFLNLAGSERMGFKKRKTGKRNAYCYAFACRLIEYVSRKPWINIELFFN